MLTFSKFAAFSTISYLLYRFLPIFPLIHDLLRATGFITVTILFSWHASGLLINLITKSRKSSRGEGKSVLITGCDTGFGHAIALQLNRSGFTVFAGVLFPDRPEAQSLLSKCKHPDKMHLLSLNVRSSNDAEQAYNRIKEHGHKTGEHLFALINNAGISGWAPLEWGSMEQDVEPVIDVDLTSVMRITRMFLPMMKQQPKSRIVFMTSYVTHISVPFIAGYVVAKKGVKAFADVLRAEVSGEPDMYNEMKILNVEPTAYKTGLLGYDVVSRAVDETWSRTNDRVKQAYGHEIYDAFKTFISVSKFFQHFDFLFIRSDLSEVSLVMDRLLRLQDPDVDTAVMPFYNYLFYRFVHNYVPDEVLECFFHFVAMQGLIFAFEVSCFKTFFRW